MDFVELVKAIIIGLVEGITEWLPVSSTGHMIIVEDFITLNVSAEFWEMFLVVIQLGAILAVIVLYFQRLNPFARRKTADQRQATWQLWGKVVLACIPAAIVGFTLDNWVEEHFFNLITVALALVVYGIAFIIVEKIKVEPFVSRPVGAHSAAPAPDSSELVDSPAGSPAAPSVLDEVAHLSLAKALGIGCFQCLALIPGTSRSGSTILGGRILGVSRAAAAEFSFFLAIPVMFGWSLLKLLKTFIAGVALTTTEWGVFFTGIVVAFILSIVAIRFLMGFIKKHSFAAFGWYRIVLGIVLIAYFTYSGRLLFF